MAVIKIIFLFWENTYVLVKIYLLYFRFSKTNISVVQSVFACCSSEAQAFWLPHVPTSSSNTTYLSLLSISLLRDLDLDLQHL